MSAQFDAIVVGARCAGSPTAMLLARPGHRVLLVDRATFPSDTLSTHAHPRARRRRAATVGPARRGHATRLPADRRPTRSTSAPSPSRARRRPCDGGSTGYAPRRHLLDKHPGRRRRAGRRRAARALLGPGRARRGRRGRRRPRLGRGRAAGHRAGADRDRRRRHATPTSREAVGSRGVHGQAAAAVTLLLLLAGPAARRLQHRRAAGPRLGRHPDQRRPDPASSSAGRTPRPQAYKADVEGNYLRDARAGPRVRRAGARRHPRGAVRSAARCPNYLRKPYGPGWALVGDAGYNKDPITAQGMSDAFRDAELCAAAVHDVLQRQPGLRGRDVRLPDDPRRRVLPLYEFTTQLATLAPPTTGGSPAAGRRGTATGRRWTCSPASSPAPSPRWSSSARRTSAASSALPRPPDRPTARLEGARSRQLPLSCDFGQQGAHPSWRSRL